ncbi:type 1 glutamine amidotransferase family protein [Vagococcus silagei]|uniref:Glutamine amidotransferase n=1 Tax=Vagococcus silagei TaxID=2508885 RepID=A0A4S3B730_9ENTE|nr:type 1 glutamine amidotransferase family protein [Vagococcus silagei]THB60485.1 glutamine amidotransferase [Vagococcus silagei]
MKTAIIFILENYADWEGAYLMSQLNQNPAWEVKTASLKKEIKSIGGLRTKVDYLLSEIPANIDLFVMIGGNAWHLENQVLVDKINEFLSQNVTVGAICGAVDFLAKNGLLAQYKHTGNSVYLWQDFTMYQNSEEFVEVQAIRDKNLITANGTAALDFTELVLSAVEFDTADNIEKTIYMYRFGYYAYCEKYGNPYL